MKVKVGKNVESFKPVTLTITIETEQEFCDLYERMSQAPIVISNGRRYSIHEASHDNHKLFQSLDSLLNNEYKYLKK